MKIKDYFDMKKEEINLENKKETWTKKNEKKIKQKAEIL